jgi:hypothetical protein
LTPDEARRETTQFDWFRLVCLNIDKRTRPRGVVTD